ncbi:hypothetical protein RY831_23305 [Noviherbaspirillum sp. CPCC 100848]|uniref:Major facilitator superfamily (MFS) profile domain-containing protein n=1 Tax=Noviherbaspirillum album TaxID=3080276 RepID=A0ABU6JEY8_9BURK|nr:hypothetical protein [Noviherbaspirillum sp. CPCC 100848]MEC4722100.1 hypothetical protein [Noviherbaspirillum sp. CPCC 100848]
MKNDFSIRFFGFSRVLNPLLMTSKNRLQGVLSGQDSSYFHLQKAFQQPVSAAGRLGTGALAGVTTLGYSGILIGPPVIGFLAQFSGMQSALLFVGLMCVLISVSARRASQLR